MDLQQYYSPRDPDTITNFYESIGPQVTRNMNSISQKKIDHISRVERHRFNLNERCENFKGDLRDNNLVYHEYTDNARNQIWITKPKS